jgi:hypothetical protein
MSEFPMDNIIREEKNTRLEMEKEYQRLKLESPEL